MSTSHPLSPADSVPEAAEKPAGSLGLLDHFWYAGAWLGFLAVMLLAHHLVPNPAGLGTHTELGLPPCGFYEYFHKPCPSCGMTTSFAWMMHGHFLKALEVQPGGAAVFLACLAAWLYAPVAWVKHRPFWHYLELKIFLPVCVTLITIILTFWIWRLLG